MNCTKEQQHFLSDSWTERKLKTASTILFSHVSVSLRYQFNAGRRTLASGGCKRKELLRLLELSQEVEVFTKHFTDLLLKLSRWVVWLFLRRVSLMNGWPVSRWISFCVEGSEYQKPVWLALWARCSSCVTKENRIHSRPHLFELNCREYAYSTRTCCDKGKYWFDSNFRLTVSVF